MLAGLKNKFSGSNKVAPEPVPEENVNLVTEADDDDVDSKGDVEDPSGFFDQAKAKATAAAAAAKAKVKDIDTNALKEKASHHARNVSASASAAAKKMTNEADAAYEQHVSEDTKAKISAAKDKAGVLKAEAKQKIDDKVKQGKVAVLNKANQYVDQALDIAQEKIVLAATDDNDMPKLVVRAVNYTIRQVWPDIALEVKAALNKGLRKQNTIQEGPTPSNCLGRARGWFLYTMMPYDKSIWGKIRAPSWWFLTILFAFPLFGVRQFFFLLVFLLIDRGDEFQLLRFILGFKGYQFVSGGLIAGLVGGFRFYRCVSFIYPNADFGSGGDMRPQLEFTCDDNGPGAELNFFVEASSFLLVVVLVWAAFFFFPCSVRKGNRGFKTMTSDEQAQLALNEARAERGCCSGEEAGSEMDKQQRRLKRLLVYDSCMFLLSVVLLAVVVIVKTDTAYKGMSVMDIFDDFRFLSDLYWCMVFYSLTTLPYMLFALPVVSVLVSHAKPTGYNHLGNCVPVQPPPKRNRSKDAKAEELMEGFNDDGESEDTDNGKKEV